MVLKVLSVSFSGVTGTFKEPSGDDANESVSVDVFGIPGVSERSFGRGGSRCTPTGSMSSVSIMRMLRGSRHAC